MLQLQDCRCGPGVGSPWPAAIGCGGMGRVGQRLVIDSVECTSIRLYLMTRARLCVCARACKHACVRARASPNALDWNLLWLHTHSHAQGLVGGPSVELRHTRTPTL